MRLSYSTLPAESISSLFPPTGGQGRKGRSPPLPDRPSLGLSLDQPVEVLPAIKLNDDCGFQANEVTNIDADRMLPSELEAAQLAAT